MESKPRSADSVRFCDSLNENGLHILIYLNTGEWHYLRKIRTYGLVREDVACYSKCVTGGGL